LQVEHPVTEEVTGLDLVQMQIESAQGLPLSVTQKDIKGAGYALEARLYAEDASNDFLPVTGTIQRFEYPEVDGLRVETAIRSGSKISVFYDPMIAKIIVHDASRAAVMRKMKYVLKNLICQGMTTNQDFLLHMVENAEFQAGQYDTHFIKNKIDLASIATKDANDKALAGIAATLHGWQQRENGRTLLRSMPSGWRNNFYAPQFEEYTIEETDWKISYRSKDKQQFEFYICEEIYTVGLISADDQHIRAEINETQYTFQIAQNGQDYFVHNERMGNITITQKERFPAKEVAKVAGGYETPMPSQIIKVLVKEGQKVKSGEGLVILSSMKMENTIEAVEDGVVEEVYATEGGNVEAGFLLLKLATEAYYRFGSKSKICPSNKSFHRFIFRQS